MRQNQNHNTTTFLLSVYQHRDGFLYSIIAAKP